MMASSIACRNFLTLFPVFSARVRFCISSARVRRRSPGCPKGAFLSRIYNAYKGCNPKRAQTCGRALMIGWDEPGNLPTSPRAVPLPDPAVQAGEFGFKFDRSDYRVPAIMVSPLVEPGSVYNEEHRHTSLIATPGEVIPREALHGTRRRCPHVLLCLPPSTLLTTRRTGQRSKRGRCLSTSKMRCNSAKPSPPWASQPLRGFAGLRLKTTSRSRDCPRTQGCHSSRGGAEYSAQLPCAGLSAKTLSLEDIDQSLWTVMDNGPMFRSPLLGTWATTKGATAPGSALA